MFLCGAESFVQDRSLFLVIPELKFRCQHAWCPLKPGGSPLPQWHPWLCPVEGGTLTSCGERVGGRPLPSGLFLMVSDPIQEGRAVRTPSPPGEAHLLILSPQGLDFSVSLGWGDTSIQPKAVCAALMVTPLMGTREGFRF